MNDNEIIKALECCRKPVGTGACKDCPLDKDRPCTTTMIENALDLINRKDSKIAELTEENNRQQAEIDVKRKLLEKAEAKFESYENCERILICQLAEEREKAIKEFAERLKEKCKQARFSVTVTENLTSTKKVLDNIAVVDESDIDNLVKEMVGEG